MENLQALVHNLDRLVSGTTSCPVSPPKVRKCDKGYVFSFNSGEVVVTPSSGNEFKSSEIYSNLKKNGPIVLVASSPAKCLQLSNDKAIDMPSSPFTPKHRHRRTVSIDSSKIPKDIWEKLERNRRLVYDGQNRWREIETTHPSEKREERRNSGVGNQSPAANVTKPSPVQSSISPPKAEKSPSTGNRKAVPPETVKPSTTRLTKSVQPFEYVAKSKTEVENLPHEEDTKFEEAETEYYISEPGRKGVLTISVFGQEEDLKHVAAYIVKLCDRTSLKKLSTTITTTSS